MSTQRKRDFIEQGPSEQSVHDYLIANPDFFERHRALLGKLRLPHGASGAVSLVERQVSLLRQKEFKLGRQLKELIEVARVNDALVAKIHALTLQLLAARDLQATVTVIEESIRSSFGADQSVLVVFGAPELFRDIDTGRFFRVIDRASDSLRPFATFLAGRGPRCGQVRDAQRDLLFPSHAEEIGSVALVPLGRKSEIGFLAIGSADADRFHPGMSTDFLARIGDLVSASLRRH